MPGDRRDGLPQGPGGEPVRLPQFRLPPAHRRAHPLPPVLRRRRIRHAAAAAGAGRSAEIPRRAPLHGAAEGGEGEDRPGGRRDGRRGNGRGRSARRRGAGFRLHGRLARHGGGDAIIAGARGGGGAERPLRAVRRLGRRAHAGGHPLADAAAAHDHRRRHGEGCGASLHRRAHQSDDRRRDRLLRHARRRAHCRARRADRLCRAARHRADDPRAAAGGLSARRISARPRHGRHRRPPPQAARDGGAALPAHDEAAAAQPSVRQRSLAGRERAGGQRRGCGAGRQAGTDDGGSRSGRAASGATCS